MLSPEMTVADVAGEMRAAGFHVSNKAIVDRIASGLYPFGRIIGVGRSGRRTVHVLRVDFQRWLENVTRYEEVYQE